MNWWTNAPLDEQPRRWWEDAPIEGQERQAPQRPAEPAPPRGFADALNDPGPRPVPAGPPAPAPTRPTARPARSPEPDRLDQSVLGPEPYNRRPQPAPEPERPARPEPRLGPAPYEQRGGDDGPVLARDLVADPTLRAPEPDGPYANPMTISERFAEESRGPTRPTPRPDRDGGRGLNIAFEEREEPLDRPYALDPVAAMEALGGGVPRRPRPTEADLAAEEAEAEARIARENAAISRAGIDPNPAGVGATRAIERGLLRTASTLPTLSAISFAAAVQDSRRSEGDILADTVLAVTGLEEMPPGVDTSSLEAAYTSLEAMGFPITTTQNLAQMFDARVARATEAREDPQFFLEQYQEAIGRAATLQERASLIPMSPGSERMALRLQEDQTVGGTIATLIRNPVEALTFLGEIAAESTPQIAASGAATLLTRNPAVGAAVMGAGTVGQETGSSAFEYLAEQGVRIETPEDAIAALNTPGLLQEAAARGLTRSVVIAAFEMAGQGVAARRLMESPVGDALAQSIVQGATGSAGEAGAQLATGQELNPQEIILEGLAELVTAPLEVGPAMFTVRNNERGGDEEEPQASPGALPAPTAPVVDPDPERLNSPRLTPSDRASPVPNAVIDDGLAALEAIERGEPLPTVPAAEAPAPDMRPPAGLGAALEEAPPEVQTEGGQRTVETPATPADPATPILQTPPDGRRLSAPIPVIDEDGNETGETMAVDLDTGEQVITRPAAAPQPATQPTPRPEPQGLGAEEAPTAPAEAQAAPAEAPAPTAPMAADGQATPAAEGQATAAAEGEQASPAAAGSAPQVDSAGRPAGSWIVIDRESGDVVTELQDRRSVDRVNLDRYEPVPAGDYLGQLNQRIAAADGANADADMAGARREIAQAAFQRRTGATPVQAPSTPVAEDAPNVAPPADVRPRTQAEGIEVLTNETLGNVVTDAATFQYKGGGDASGVTDRLANVRRWDDNRTGIALVYEYEDGRRAIVDGHQRFGLAQRLAAEGQRVNLPVRILRQSDGVTEADARAIGAEKNIAEGSGSAVDAARIFRETRRTARDLDLPMSSAMVRDADGMSRLSQDAFGLVLNGVATERDAAIVGNLVPDEARQSDILGLVARLRPANAVQTESIVRQAREAEVRETQTSLFGEEEVSANLYLERARVLDQALKDLGRERATFRTLVDRADAIAEAGNVLEGETNAARVDEVSRARAVLSSEANTKGPTSEALTAAARAVRDGTPVASAARDFLASIRANDAGAASVDPAGGPQAGPAGRDDGPAQAEGAGPAAGDQDAAAVGPATEATAAGEQSLFEGVAPITDQDRLQQQADRPMGNDRPRGDDTQIGGLFDPMDPSRVDLFDQPAATAPETSPAADPEAAAPAVEPGQPQLDDLGNPIPNVSTSQVGVTPQQARGGAAASTPAARGPRADNTTALTMEEQDRLAELRNRFRNKARNQLNAGLDPELVSIAAEMAGIYIKAGARKFRDLVRAMMEDLGLTFDQVQPYARGAYNQVRDDMDLDGQDVSDMDTAQEVMSEVRAMRAEAQEGTDAPGTSGDLEQDRGGTVSQDGLGAADVPAAGRDDGEGAGARGGASGGRGRGGRGRGGVSARDAAGVGAGGDRAGRGEARPEPGAAADQDGAGGRDRGEQGLPDDDGPDQATAQYATDAPERGERAEQQRRADRIAVVPTDEANIRETLPLLMPEQQDDVLKVERRFAKPDGFGMLLTNGTGTGKTYSAGGVIKRFVQQGKDNVLILAPSQPIVDAWVGMGRDMGMAITPLADTKDAGSGVVATTYTNAGMNNALASRDWDLVVNDEAHKLSSAKDGGSTDALKTVRAITNRPEDIRQRARMLHAAEWDAWKAMPEGDAKTAELSRLRAQDDATRAELAQKPRSRVLFLSATPFAYDRNTDYAEGYLFRYPSDGTTDSGSRQSGQNLFMVENFGYRIRYHRLTQPEAAVDRGVFEREFHERMKREGALSGRSLDIEADYDRRFVAVDSEIGQRIDEALKYLNEQRDTEQTRGDWDVVRKLVGRHFNYLKRMQLLEAIKAEKAIPDIQRHLDMGRKVVVFHDYNVGGGRAPFALPIGEGERGYDQYQQMHADLPWLKDLNFSGLASPKVQILNAFGDRARQFAGKDEGGQNIPQRTLRANMEAFNRDGSGVDVLVVNSAKGEAGISLHDTTGGHQRALINLGMPVRPVTTLQEEGRIRRVGSVSDAIFRYYTIGTSWERQAFAAKIAEQSGTVENLALGNEARAIRESFIEAYSEADRYEPGMEGEGKGGRDRDRSVALTTPYDQAKTHYFGRMKNTRSRANRQGTDFYATPEPLGFKMVGWAAPREYEKVLEPSAGDGAIARYFPENTDRTIVEPSFELSTQAQLRANGARNVTGRFEDLHINNKFDTVVMNPPFGMGGKTAYEHVQKAMRHLRPGGRIVALVPTGPAADKRMASLFDPEQIKADEWHMTATVALPRVTFEKAGTGVATQILVIDRTMEVVDAPTQRINMTGADTIERFFERLEGIEVPMRPAPIVEPGAIAEMSEEADEANLTATVDLEDASGGFESFEFTHTKTGDTVFVARTRQNTSKDVYKMTIAVAKKHGGWWNKARNNNIPGSRPGFAFPSAEDRQAFLDEMAAPVQVKEQRNLTNRDDDHATEAIFYSPLLRAVQGAKQSQAPARDWQAILRKMPGVKQVEMEWLGVYDWLDSQEGAQVPRATLEQFIRDGQIQLVEERLAGDEDADSMNLDIDIDDNNYVEPDWAEEADLYMDEARDELESELDEDESPDEADVRDRAEELARQRWEPTEWTAEIYDRDSGDYLFSGYWNSDTREYYFPDLGDFTDRHDAMNAAEEKIREDREAERRAQGEPETDGPARFPQEPNYNEPGGTNYREVLLRVPNLHESGRNAPRRTSEQEAALADLDRQEEEILSRTGTLDQSALATISMRRNDIFRASEMPRRPFVQSLHFEQENIVVHARVKDRTGPNGEKILFIEEIQSDLATKWREATESPEVTARRRELVEQSSEDRRNAGRLTNAAKREWARVRPEQFEGQYSSGRVDMSIVYQMVAETRPESVREFYADWVAELILAVRADPQALEASRQVYEMSQRMDARNDELLRLGTERSMDPSIPDTPFKEEHTYALMVKRLLREAAENGYDRVAWTPGYMQAERWDTAAQSVVEEVRWGEAPQGFFPDAPTATRMVSITMSGGNIRSLAVGNSGTILQADDYRGIDLTGKQLSSLVGPGLANQVLAEPSGTVSGQKITFPDSGYAIAYDQQIKRSVDKLAKGTGARVEQVRDLPDMGGGVVETSRAASTLTAEEIEAFYRSNGKQDRIDEVQRELARVRDEYRSEQERNIAGLQRLLDDGAYADNPSAQATVRDQIAARENNLNVMPQREANTYRQLLVRSLTPGDLAQLLPRERRIREGNPVWSITITPELREKALAPQPILQKPAFDMDNATLMDEAVVREILPGLRKRLDQQGLSRVNLGFDFKMRAYGETRIYARLGKIDILIGASPDMLNTLYHESIHALHAMKLFSDMEWNRLVKAARETWMDEFDIAERYPDLTQAEQIEEAIAEAYGKWAVEQNRSGLPGGLRLTMEKIRRFLRSLADALFERGFFTPEDVFGRALAGEIGRRRAGNTGSRRLVAAGNGEADMRAAREQVPGGDAFAADFMVQLAESDELFNLPTSEATRPADIFAMAAPEVRYAGRMSEGAGREGDAERHLFRIGRGADFFVYQTDDEVWFDVSQLQEGEGGSRLYAAVADYAYNTGRVFIGDPEGLSDAALIRRTDAMLSSALKRGTTRHLAPHPRQLAGEERVATPLRWREGDDLANLQAMIETSTFNVLRKVPDLFDARYDFTAGTFRDAAGAPLSDEVLEGRASATGGVREARTGSRTLKRAILLNTLLRAESGQRPGLLEQVLRQHGQLVERGQIAGIFYQRPDADAEPMTIREQRPAHAVRPLSANGRQKVAQATQTAHIPDRRVFDELARRNISLLDRGTGTKAAVMDRIDRTRVLLQDRMLPLLRAEQAIGATTGEQITKDRSAYYAEERYTGRVGDRLDRFDEDYTKPIVSLIVDADRGRTPLTLTDARDGSVLTGAEAAGLWLEARHARERNARIAQINPSMPDGGAGMTNDEADAILAEAATGPNARRLDQIGTLTDRLGREMIDWREEVGLLSPEEAQIWRSMYRHYVPLRGFAETDMHDAVVNEYYGINRRYTARGPESQRSLGRRSRAYNPLATMLTMGQEVIVRSEKNRVGQTAVKLAQDFPNPAMWEVAKVEQQRVFNRATGMVETRVVDPKARPLAQDEMAVKINGEEVRLRLKDPQLANALGKIGSQELDALSSRMAVFSRYFSAVNTMLSPPFVIVNAFRDFMTAQVNVGEQVPRGMQSRVRGAMLRDWVRAFNGARRGMRGDTSTQWAQYFREYEAAGAKVSFWKIETPELQMDDLNRRIQLESGNRLQRGLRKATRLNTRDNPALNWIERMNLSVDNAIRLAAFVEARSQGMTIEDAASLSKNLTVNFNRRGEFGATMNAWFPFANAAIQGTQILFKAMSSRQVQGIVLGMVAFGIANDVLNAALSEEDDDGELEYDQIPAWVLQRNLVLPMGGEEFATVPLPYGFNFFFYLGNRISKVARGVVPADRAVGQVLMTGLGAFSPLSGETAHQIVMPTLLDHITELNSNRDWLGRPIRPEPAFGDYGPQSYREWNASEPSRFIAQGLNALTGGSTLEPGFIDISPEYFDHTVAFLGGGAGRFAMQTGNLAQMAAQGNLSEVEAYQIPLLRVMRTESGDFLDRNRYFRFRETVESARAMVRRAEEMGVEPVASHVLAASVNDALRRAESDRRDLQGRLNAIYADTSLSAGERLRAVGDVRRQMEQEVFKRFNAVFIERMGPQAE